jgi:hypothetical protein
MFEIAVLTLCLLTCSAAAKLTGLLHVTEGTQYYSGKVSINGGSSDSNVFVNEDATFKSRHINAEFNHTKRNTRGQDFRIQAIITRDFSRKEVSYIEQSL